jgi:hypothetical protein
MLPYWPRLLPAEYRGLFMLRQRTEPENEQNGGIGRRQKKPRQRGGGAKGGPATLKMASAQPGDVLVARNGWTVQVFAPESTRGIPRGSFPQRGEILCLGNKPLPAYAG